MNAATPSTRPSDVALTTVQAREVRRRLAALPSGAEVIHDHRQQTLLRFQAAGLDLLAKRYVLRTLSDRLVARLGHSRAARSHRAALRLLAAGISTPRPYLHQVVGGVLPTTAVLVTDWQDGRRLPDHLRAHPDDQARLVEPVIAIAAALRAHGLSHGDLHAQNILVDPGGGLHVIDLDGSRSHLLPSRLRTRCERDRSRLVGSLREFPDLARRLDERLALPV